MIHLGKRHDCAIELREADLRITPARLAVLNFLEKSDRPSDVTAIIDYLDKQKINSDPVTAFRIINLFTQKGIARRIQFQEGKFRYELAGKKDHHHLLCLNCGSIKDIEDKSMGRWENKIRQKTGFLVKNHSLEFFGICKKCQH